MEQNDAATIRPARGATMRQLTTLYLAHAEEFIPSDLNGIRAMVKRVNAIAGELSISQFRPRMFKRVREAMIAAGNTRGYINQQHNRIVAMLKFAVEEEMASAEIPAAIAAVKKLKRGRGGVKEGRDVNPAPDGDIQAALEKMPDPRQPRMGFNARNALAQLK